jgi:predicted component of type VI protein secretion system
MDLSYYTDSRTISHRHCQIFYDTSSRHWLLENFGRNGTRVNDKQIGRQGEPTIIQLESGSTIEMGKFTMRFMLKPFKLEEFLTKRGPFSGSSATHIHFNTPTNFLPSAPQFRKQ